MDEATKRRGRKPKGAIAMSGSQRARVSRERKEAEQAQVMHALMVAVGEMLTPKQYDRLSDMFPSAVARAGRAYEAAEAEYQAQLVRQQENAARENDADSNHPRPPRCASRSCA